jgi:hypothetical protein
MIFTTATRPKEVKDKLSDPCLALNSEALPESSNRPVGFPEQLL